jgi:hypothetical protein
LKPDEELFCFLYYMRSYPNKGFDQMEQIFGLSSSAGDSSFLNLLRILSDEFDSPLKDEIVWPSAQERAQEKELLSDAGVPESFFCVVAWVDGVKQ